MFKSQDVLLVIILDTKICLLSYSWYFIVFWLQYGKYYAESHLKAAKCVAMDNVQDYLLLYFK